MKFMYRLRAIFSLLTERSFMLVTRHGTVTGIQDVDDAFGIIHYGGQTCMQILRELVDEADCLDVVPEELRDLFSSNPMGRFK